MTDPLLDRNTDDSVYSSEVVFFKQAEGTFKNGPVSKRSLYDDLKTDMQATLTEPVPHSHKELEESFALLPEDLSGEEGEGHGHNTGDEKDGIFASSLNIANTCLGAGILALAYVMKEFGILLSLMIFILSYALCVFSCFLLLKAKNLSGHSKYSTIGVYSVGRLAEKLIKIMVIINNTGLCIVYLVLFGKTAHNVLSTVFSSPEEASSSFSPKLLIPIVALIMLPLAFAKKMARLKIVSLIAVSGISVFCILTFYIFIKKWIEGSLPGGINFLPSSDFSLVRGITCVPTVFLAFTFQFNFFPVYKSLKDANDLRMRKVTLLSLTMVLSFYILVALCGYLSYGPAITSEGLIDSFSANDLGSALYLILMFAFLLSSTLSFPLMFFGARNNIWSVILSISKRMKKDWRIREKIKETHLTKEEIVKTLPKTTVTISWQVYAAYVVSLYILLVAAAVFANGIGSLLGIVGAIAANAISYIFPALFYVMLTKRKHQKWWYISWFMLVFGIICGIISFILHIVGFINKE
mmetsp:Transcript_70971/g.82623  ORF Transcript_70971/g.82623 Transcript_70971/m.82623 type:complete len:524 (+) Transcript_70971:41-1612(+)